MRRDAEILLQKVDIALDQLICLDEFTNSRLFDSKRSKMEHLTPQITLLDHNKMSAKLLKATEAIIVDPAEAVVEILDHHADSQLEVI